MFCFIFSWKSLISSPNGISCCLIALHLIRTQNDGSYQKSGSAWLTKPKLNLANTHLLKPFVPIPEKNETQPDTKPACEWLLFPVSKPVQVSHDWLLFHRHPVCSWNSLSSLKWCSTALFYSVTPLQTHTQKHTPQSKSSSFLFKTPGSIIGIPSDTFIIHVLSWK